MNEFEKEYAEKYDGYYKHERLEMLQYIPVGVSSVLDVGCSNGTFGANVKKRFGCEVWGIEPDKSSAIEAESKLDRVYNTFFTEKTDLGTKKFDIIFFNDVLEHIPNPDNILVLCKNLLKENGLIIASIPNIRFFDAIYHIVVEKDFKYMGAGIFDKTHLRFFTQKSILRMFSESGYNVTKLEGINSIKELNYKGFRNFRILNLLLMGKISDMEFLQFAVVAKIK